MDKGMMMSGWIGVDLDGTLARYDGGQGVGHIGAPIEPMIARVREWLSQGHEVRIFTARAQFAEQIPPVEAWCKKHLGVQLPVTCAKDFGMIELWDDRCVQVVTNTGRRADGLP
jgi:hypothetical protein